MDSNKDATDAFQMRRTRTRERLASSTAECQRAVAEFPLRVANVAKDLASMCDVRDSGHVMHKDTEEVMRYMEDQIRQCYREMFGTELGQANATNQSVAAIDFSFQNVSSATPVDCKFVKLADVDRLMREHAVMRRRLLEIASGETEPQAVAV